jgi:limonene-1,2-epoxide hydrolase
MQCGWLMHWVATTAASRKVRDPVMTPTELVREFVAKFNAADVDGLANMYAEDAINEQVVLARPLVGRAEIHKLLRIDFARAKMVCVEERIYECGDTAILQWSDPIGLKGCGFFQFRNDKIIHQKGYFDQLTFFKTQGLPIPDDYLSS